MSAKLNKVLPSCLLAAGLCIATAPGTSAHAEDVRPELRIQPAEHVAAANQEMMLSAALAGKRIVAVGNRGVVLLSDDDGKTYRQARTVPVSTSLTGVWFADAQVGWAVGHWGAILKTSDGGETWNIQRSDITVDQPLFSVYFESPSVGWAAGLWSLLLHTTDGGANWSAVKVPPPPGAKKSDRNLYDIFSDSRGTIFIACEQGRVMRSADHGASWTYFETGYMGSFWTGMVLEDGTVLVGGLRGSIYRSRDGGNTWMSAQNPIKSSITGLLQLADRSIIAIALDGVSLVSRDGGASFTGTQRKDRVALTAAVATADGVPVLFSAAGPVSR